MRSQQFVRWAVLVGSVGVLSGCSSYYAYYGRFQAETSQGHMRDAVIAWYTNERGDWSLLDSEGTAITLQTQCSQRTLRFAPNALCSSDKSKIVWCGEPGKDLDWKGRPITTQDQVCGEIRSAGARNTGSGVADLGTTIELTIQCYPATPVVQQGEETLNFDYIRASSVPYRIRVKKVEMGSAEDRMPELSEKGCK
ncbi:hypothetical protein AAIA72_03925 [Hahella sp. SMD15-11]|uniref:Uncharacterized protein n=1 Tax=Thermohahella caldifontis TaxID=3142973 RepID=A0AB39UYQ6_9GAMM